MSISLRELFTHQGIQGEAISLRNSLSNHYQGLQLGLREAHSRFLQPTDGKASGCHSGSLGFGKVIPAWVSVHPSETRTVEGVLIKSKITSTDFPLKPWHTYYDWNFIIKPDLQYTYLNSPLNEELNKDERLLECEWDTGHCPSWAWPQVGDRVMMVGRWIYDCGHPGGDHQYRSEIHPPKALVSFRRDGTILPGNVGPTQTNNAVVFIGREGGYWQQAINDQNYAFDLYLPPKPYAEAIPKWSVIPKTGNLPVQPQITPLPVNNPRYLRVVIPLQGVSLHPAQYGAIIAGGWSDPQQTETAKMQQIRVTVSRIFMDGDYDTLSDEWYVYIGINGRWRFWESIGGDSEVLSYSVDLDLHPEDKIHVTGCGFEADILHDYMGKNSGFSWSKISNPNMPNSERFYIAQQLLLQLASSYDDQNEAIGLFSQKHSATTRGAISPLPQSDKKDYRLVGHLLCT